MAKKQQNSSSRAKGLGSAETVPQHSDIQPLLLPTSTSAAHTNKDAPLAALPDATPATPQGIEEESFPQAPAAKSRRGRVLFPILIPVFALVAVFSLWQIFAIQFEYQAANNEYEDLRQRVFDTGTASAAPLPAGENETESAATAPPEITLEAVMALNAECIGWIEIPNSALSYPLVRAADNEKYLDTTFLGQQNTAGAIFMDYRNAADFTAPHTILYGHNMKNGNMFGQLPQYLDASYLQANPTIVLYNQNKAYTYQVFSARVGDAYDAAYRLDFANAEELASFAAGYGAPANTTQMLTLSTCTNVQDEERILVHAALVGVTNL